MITKENMKSTYIKVAIAVLIGILIKLLVPVSYDLTPKGITYLAIFIPTLFLWIVCDTGWPSILCMAFFCMTQVVPTNTVLSLTIANPTVYTVITAGVIVHKMTEHGVMKHLAKWFISRKIVHNRPYVFFTIWCLVMLINTSLMGNIIGFVLILPIMRAVCEEIECPRGTSFHKAITALTLWTGLALDACIIFFMPTALTGVGVMAGFGFAWGLFGYMKVATIPVFIMVTLVGVGVVKFVIKPDVSNFWKYDDAAKRAELKANPLSKAGKVCTAILIVHVFFSGIAGALGLGKFSEWASSVGMAGFVMFFVGIMALIVVDGKPLHNVGPDGNSIPWKAMIFVATTFMFSSTFNSADYGIVTTMMKVLSPVAAKLPPVLVIIIGAVICLVITNFMSNVVTCFMCLSVFIPILMGIGIPDNLVQAVGVVYICLCSLAFCTPSGSPGNGLIMGIEVENKEIVKYSVIFCAIMLVVYCAVLLPLGSLMFA